MAIEALAHLALSHEVREISAEFRMDRAAFLGARTTLVMAPTYGLQQQLVAGVRASGSVH